MSIFDPIKTDHADLLNRLDNMISSPYYALRRNELREAVRVILEQEEHIKHLEEKVKADGR